MRKEDKERRRRTRKKKKYQSGYNAEASLEGGTKYFKSRPKMPGESNERIPRNPSTENGCSILAMIISFNRCLVSLFGSLFEGKKSQIYFHFFMFFVYIFWTKERT
ncbi:MAG: hypothetical protein Q8P67_06565 [archaeon]|nr:hypothetical protein [archaeon]